MQSSLPALITKNEERLVDRTAITLKSLFGVGYADVSQEELEERLYRLYDALAEITRQIAPDLNLIDDVVESVMVSPVYSGWDNRAITEEVLQVVDMVVNQQIERDLAKPEQTDDRQASQELLAHTIRTAKDVVNGRTRRAQAERTRRQSRWSGEKPNTPPTSSEEVSSE